MAEFKPLTARLLSKSRFFDRFFHEPISRNAKGLKITKFELRTFSMVPFFAIKETVYIDKKKRLKQANCKNLFCKNTSIFSLIFGAFANIRSIDILCHRNTDGQLALFNLQNAQLFPPVRNFCENGTQVLSADLNGDQIDDLLCHKRSGDVSFLLNTGVGGFVTGKKKTTLLKSLY